MRLTPRHSVLFVAIAITACGAAAPQDDRQVTRMHATTNGRAIVDRIGLPLPDSATIDYAQAIPGMDDAARIIVEMSGEDWDNFRKALPLSDPDQPPFDSAANGNLGPDADDWKPGEAAGLQTAQFPWNDDAEALNVGFAPIGDGRVRVFLFWHQL